MKRKMLLLICLILFIVSIAGVSASESANQTITDDTLSVSQSDGEIFESADGGTFTDLQKKINDANESDVINLENDYKYDSGFSTNGITINKALTIEGNGHVIDANGQARIFYIEPDVNITLKNLILKNAYTEGEGGAIYAYNIDLTVTNTIFTNNLARTGGAIYANESNIILSHDKFLKNQAMLSGGSIIARRSNVDISNTLFEDSYAGGGGSLQVLSNGKECTGKFENNIFKNSTATYTAGFFYTSIPTTIINCTFENYGDGEYGGVVSQNNLNVINSRFKNSHAILGGALGLDSNNDWVVENCTFENCHAQSGGAIYFNGHLTISSSYFVNNSAEYDGGAMYGEYGSDVNCTFIDNFANNSGGAIYMGNNALNSNIGGKFINNSATYGGAVYFSAVSYSNIMGIYINNTADEGGAIYSGSASNCNIGGKFINNTAISTGAIYSGTVINSNILGIFISSYKSYGTIDAGTFSDLQSKINEVNEGSLIILWNDYVYDSGFSNEGITINKALTIEGNGHVIDANGQARIFYIEPDVNITLKNLILKNAYTEGEGGVIYAYNIDLTVINTIFTNNLARTGGAIYANESNIILSHDKFLKNQALLSGGSIIARRSNVDISNTLFEDSYAGGGGSLQVLSNGKECTGKFENNIFKNSTATYTAGFFYTSIPTTIINCTFENYDGGEYGGVVSQNNLNVIDSRFKNSYAILGGALGLDSNNDWVVENCTFENCHAQSGGAIYFNGHLTISSSYFVNNSAEYDGGAMYGEYGSDVNCTFINNFANNSGGAIYFASVSNCSVSGVFVNNCATYDGGAIYIDGDASNCNIGGEFINNTANGATGIIFIKQKVSNSIILDNLISNSFSYHAAKTSYVDNLASDDGNGNINTPFNSLKSAINYANSGDIISIAPGTYTGEDNVDLTIDKTLTLDNSGDGDVIFDARNNGRIFTINANSFNIRGLTFTHATDSAIVFNNGLVYSVIEADFRDNEKTAGKGGALCVQGNISDSIFIGNYSNNSVNGSGGAIYADNIVDSTFNCDFSNNGACDEGGVIHANISDSTFNGDFTDNAALIGGVIYGNVSDSTFNGDFTRNNGGVIYGNVSYSIFNGDFIANNAGDGTFPEINLLGFAPVFGGMPTTGGVINGNVINSAFNSNFVDNTANFGAVINGNVGKSFFTGDILNNIADTCAVVTGKIYTSVFCGDIAQDIIDFASGKLSDMLNSFIKKEFAGVEEDEDEKNIEFKIKQDIHIWVDGNLPKDGDGLIRPFNNLYEAIALATMFWTQKTFFSDTLFEFGHEGITLKIVIGDIIIHVAPGVYRGEKNIGLDIYADELYITNDNLGDVILDAENSESIFIAHTPKLKIDGLTFMHASNSALVFKNGTINSEINANFIDNTAKDNGGAIYVNTDIINSVFSGNFINNHALNYQGGAIYINGSALDSTFSGNFIDNSASWGGAICIKNIIEDSIFSGKFINNSARSMRGGAISTWCPIHNSIFSGDFINNSARDYGGVIYAPYFDDSNFTGDFINNSAKWGGAISCYNKVSNSIFSGNFIDNSASLGGAIYSSEYIYDSIFSGNFASNSATYRGGAIYSYNRVSNSIFSGNFIDNSAAYGGAIYADSRMVNCTFDAYYRGNTAEYGNVLYAGYFHDIPLWEQNYHNRANIPESDIYDVEYESYKEAMETYGRSSSVGNALLGTSFNEICSTYYENNKRSPESDYLSGSIGNSLLATSLNKIYVDGSALVDGDGSPNNPFNNLNSAINQANKSDTIYIAPGTYTGENNVGLLIPQSLNLVNWGDGDVIFDAENNGIIFISYTRYLNITGLTFIRATDSALIFLNGLDGSRIEANFRDNKKADGEGGALYFMGYVSDSTFSGNYVNNKASTYGGAICANSIISCSFDCDFINNTADIDGGAIDAMIMDSTFNCNFINNTAAGDGGAIDGNIYKSSFTGNFTNNNAVNGGVVFGSASSSNFTCNFTNNEAVNGGVISGSVSSSNFNSDFANNTAKENGGAICGAVSSSNFQGNFINNNAANGGVVYSKGDVSKSVFKGVFTNDTSESGFGGVVYVTGGISSSEFTGNVFVSNPLYSVVYSARGMIVNCIFNDFNVIITAPDVSFAYKDPDGELVANIVNGQGKPLAVNLNFNFNGKDYVVKTDSDGQASIAIGTLSPGKYVATISYAESGNHEVSSTTALVTVTKADTVISVPDVSIAYKDPNGELVATIVSEHGKPLVVNLNVELNGKTYVVKTDSDGKASIPVGTLSPGKYSATISYKGSGNYKASTTTAKVTVSKADTIISAPDVSLAYKDSNGVLVATIVSEHGKALVVNLNVDFNGKTYAVKTDSNGRASIPAGTLSPGKYAASISYKGSSNYKAFSTSALVTVSKAGTVIFASDVSVAYKDPNGVLVATIVSEHGKPLVVNLNVELNGRTYNVKTDSNGQASIPVGTLSPGKYTATISYKGSGNYKASTATAKVTVTKAGTVISAPNVSLAYKDPDGELVATIVSEHGKPLVVNLNVELNGNTYAVKTDSNGEASIPVGTLSPGKYTATISYKGSGNYKASTATAKVTVTKADTIISAPDVSVAYKDSNGALVATIVNEHGKPLVVTLNVELNGKTYSVKTDSNGQASIPIDTLTPGTYTASISYKGSSNYKSSSTTAKVTVTKAATVITAPDVSVAYGDSNGKLVSTITNEHDKPLVVSLNVELNGKTYAAKTDSNGQMSVSTADLAPGTYTATVKYKGSSNYKASSTTANIQVKK